MEADPVAAPLMPIQDLDTLDLHSDEGAEILGFRELLAKNGEVPDADSGVERAGNDEVLFWMELGTHDVVAVASDDVDARSALVIPDAHGLVVA